MPHRIRLHAAGFAGALFLFAAIAVPVAYAGADSTKDGGEAVQTREDLEAYGPRAHRVVVSAASWDGTADESLRSLGPGDLPVGATFTLTVPRTIAPSGGPSGHGSEVIGHWFRIVHSDGGEEDETGGNIVCTANNHRSYYAFPNANDHLGNDAALQELLVFQRTGRGWALIALPAARTGFTHGDPPHVAGSTSRRGFAWERRADGTSKITNGTVRILPHLPGTGTGDRGPRFRGDFEFPFRFEQHVGNHRSFQFGISTKSSDVPYSALSVPRNSGTGVDGMRVTVYVADTEQDRVQPDDFVSVTITGHGNWKLLGTPGE